MPVLSARYFFLFLLFFILSFNPAFCNPESNSGALFLLISPSARVSGMGEAGTALTDESSGYYNPAAPAFSTSKWDISATSYLGGMRWLPRLAGNRTTYSSYSFQTGTRKELGGFRRGPVFIPFSLSGTAGYYRTAFDMTGAITNGNGGLGPVNYHSTESAHNFVLSGSVRFIAEIGVGATLKRIHSDLADTLKADGAAYDYGVLAKLPVVDLLESVFGKRLEINGLAPEMNLSAGASWKNLGDNLDYTHDEIDPLPRVFVRGTAASAGLTFQAPVNLNFFRYTISRDTYKPRIEGKTVDSWYNDAMKGWEFSLLETLSLRHGSFDDNDGERHYSTSGMTLSSEGLFKTLTLLRAKSGKMNYIDYILQNSSVSWTRFAHKGGVHDGMHHSQVSVQFHLQ